MAAPEQSEDGRIAIFVVETIYLLLLGVLGWLVVSERIHPTTEIGTMPTAVLWFGALGAVLLSLTGIFEHMHDWDNRYIPWHLARPLVGAAVAVIAVLILQAGILAVGSEPNASGTTTPKNLLYFLVAFLVGYREDTFRDLVKRLTDVILAPGGGAVAVAPVISGVTPGAGLAAGGESVTITGTGLLGASAVRFGSELALFTVESDTQVSARTPPGQAGSTVGVAVVTPGGSATFSPFAYHA